MTSIHKLKTVCCLAMMGVILLSCSSCSFYRATQLNDYEDFAAISNTLVANLYFAVMDIKIPNYEKAIYKDARWRKQDSPVVIDENMYILPGVTLTIEPGVTVKLAGDVLVTCRGIIRAAGTDTEPVTFTWKEANAPWDAIEFINAVGQGKKGPDEILFKHCIIEHGGGVTINTSNTHVENCEFRHNVGTPLKMEYSGGVVVNNTFHDNSTQAQAAAGNGGGINVYSDRTVLLKGNLIHNNVSHGGRDGGGGIYAFSYDAGDITVLENVVRDNKSDRKAGGIFGYRAKILGNMIESNRADKTGGGIHAIQSLVKDNVVSGNLAPVGGGIYSEGGRVVHNLVKGNGAPEGTGIFHVGDGLITRNSLVGNFFFGPEKSSAITVSGNPVVNYNNIIVPDGYALTFRSHSLTPDLKANHNYWGATDALSVEKLVYDWLEDAELGIVNWHLYQQKQIADAYPLPEDANTESMVSRDDTGPGKIRGLIDRDTVLGGSDIDTYTVTGNMLIKEGVKMTIKPGTRLQMKKDASIRVRGTLEADGTADGPVTLTVNSHSPWGKLLFENRSLDLAAKAVQASRGGKSILRHCIVENGSGIVMDGQGGDILHTIVQGNQGTGIRIKEVAVTVKHCQIRDNVSSSDGGGIYVYGSKQVLIHDNEIVNNRAADGGGIFAYGYQSNAAVDIRQNRIEGNTSEGAGGGVWVSRCAVVDNLIAGNITETKGGGVYTSYALIEDNRMSDNVAANGGGLYAETNSTIERNTLMHNKSLSGMGGGIFINFWGMSMHNKTVAHNVIEANDTAVPEGTGGVCIKGELIFAGNCIYNNTGFELANLNTSEEKDLSAEYCFWGADAMEQIAAHVHDGHDDPGLSMVDYVPFAATKEAAFRYVIPEEER